MYSKIKQDISEYEIRSSKLSATTRMKFYCTRQANAYSKSSPYKKQNQNLNSQYIMIRTPNLNKKSHQLNRQLGFQINGWELQPNCWCFSTRTSTVATSSYLRYGIQAWNWNKTEMAGTSARADQRMKPTMPDEPAHQVLGRNTRGDVTSTEQMKLISWRCRRRGRAWRRKKRHSRVPELDRRSSDAQRERERGDQMWWWRE